MAYTLQHDMVEIASTAGNHYGWVDGRYSFSGKSDGMVGILASIGLFNSR
jgi:hypothetical protein